jgi:hypothetical protein
MERGMEAALKETVLAAVDSGGAEQHMIEDAVEENMCKIDEARVMVESVRRE